MSSITERPGVPGRGVGHKVKEEKTKNQGAGDRQTKNDKLNTE